MISGPAPPFKARHLPSASLTTTLVHPLFTSRTYPRPSSASPASTTPSCPSTRLKEARLVERVQLFDLFSTMRERTESQASLLRQTPNPKLLLAPAAQLRYVNEGSMNTCYVKIAQIVERWVIGRYVLHRLTLARARILSMQREHCERRHETVFHRPKTNQTIKHLQSPAH
jgi:hypothetical protein